MGEPGAHALNHPHACPLRIHLTPEEDARLRELETNPVVPFKVRRRAQADRLAAQGRTAPRIARHLGLDRTTLHQQLGAARIFSLACLDSSQVASKHVRGGVGDGVHPVTWIPHR